MTISKERIIPELQWELLPETDSDFGCMRRRVGIDFEGAPYTGIINDEDWCRSGAGAGRLAQTEVTKYLCEAQDWIIKDIQSREVHDWCDDGFFWAWWTRQHDNQS